MSKVQTSIENLKINLGEAPAAAAEKKTTRAKQAKEIKETSLNVTEADWERVLLMKNSNPDMVKIRDVRESWRSGDTLPQAKFSKTEALRMWKRFSIERREQTLIDMVANTPKNYTLIQDEAALDTMVELMEKEPIISVDTETTGLDLFGIDHLVGLSVTLPVADLHYYIPTRHDEGKQIPNDVVMNKLRPCFENPAIGKVLFNAKFDTHVLINEGVRLNGLAADAMIIMWLLSEDLLSYRLKDLATKFLKEPSDTFAELFGKNCKFNTIPLDIALAYAAKDTDLTWRFYQWQLSHLSKDKLKEVHTLYKTVENPLVEVCINMEQTGFIVDTKFAKEYGDILKAELAEAEAELWNYFPKDINFNSPTQLKKIFYEDWQLPDISKKQSTDADTLKRLNDEVEHDGIKTLLRYRELTKLVGTYVDKLPNNIKEDGRLHGGFKQNGTVTGRFASNNPNLQNIPTLARRLFIAPPGQIIFGADYSQIEPRVLAHISGDEHFREPYNKGIDLYATLAAKVFKKPIEECGDGTKLRKMMKVGLLAVMYGTTMRTLAKQLRISVEEAEQFIEDFYISYPQVGLWIKSVWEQVKRDEFVTTMYGRKRRFPGHGQQAIQYDKLAKEICERLGVEKLPSNIWAFKKELPYKLKRAFQDVKGKVERVRRMAVNAIIQGSAADVMKLALIRLDAAATTLGYAMLATVHDEALLYVDENITVEEVDFLEEAMTGACTLDIPVKVDAMFTYRWGENELNKKEWFSRDKK